MRQKKAKAIRRFIRDVRSDQDVDQTSYKVEGQPPQYQEKSFMGRMIKVRPGVSRELSDYCLKKQAKVFKQAVKQGQSPTGG